MNQNTIALPELQEGEFYAGLILKEDGTPDYHLIGLPEELEAATHGASMKWAKGKNGDLPTCRELNLLRANARQHFQNAWYWSSEKYTASDAWCQYFYGGYQYGNYVYYELRARAVRRLPI